MLRGMMTSSQLLRESHFVSIAAVNGACAGDFSCAKVDAFDVLRCFHNSATFLLECLRPQSNISHFGVRLSL